MPLSPFQGGLLTGALGMLALLALGWGILPLLFSPLGALLLIVPACYWLSRRERG